MKHNGVNPGDSRATELLNEAVELELNVSALYMAYSHAYPEDRSFWWTLALEEQNHAALMESAHLFLKTGDLPEEVLYRNINELKKANADIRRQIEIARDFPPHRSEAFRFAAAFEDSAYEVHYQGLMSSSSGSKALHIFQNLGQADMDHAARIRGYAQQFAERSHRPPR